MDKIRRLKLEDADKYKEELINLLEDNLNINLPSNANNKARAVELWKNLKKFLENNTAIAIGSFQNDKILGFLWAYERGDFEKELFITQLVVTQKERNQGLGKKLMNNFIKIAEEMKIKKITLIATADNEQAVTYYKKCGFYVERVCLRKDLK